MRKSLPDISSRYGAPMGRSEQHAAPTTLKFTLQRVRINAGGYDSGGAYWGIGQPLYWYESEDGEVSAFLRAVNRYAAKIKILESYPSARFYR